MMRLASLMLALGIAAPAQAQPVAGLDAVFAAYTPATPGCAVGLKHAGEAPVFRAYGSADLEHAVPITPDTIFEAGSVSKQFTAAAILLLVDDGKLALSDDIRKHLPEMPDYGRPITIDMLLSHTSGLRDWGEVMDIAGWPRTSRIYNAQEILQIASRQKALNYAPGEAYSYTNTGYNLAAWIVLRVSGQTLADFTDARLFKPLGMGHTSWRDNFRRVVPGRAIAYRPVRAGFGQDMPFENTYGHGGLLTTVGDLLIWNEALSRGKLGPTLDARMRAQATLTSGRRIAYARGLVVQSYRGRAEVAHSGATAGYRAWLGRMPAEELSVALLCNRGDANPVELAHAVVASVLPTPPVPARGAASPEALVRLPGLYVDERTGSVLRIAARDGALLARGAEPLGLLAGERYELGGAAITFTALGAQRQTADGEVTTYRRVEPAQPTAAELQSLAGAYASAEAGAILVVSVRDGVLAITPADRPSGARPAEPLQRDAFQSDGALVRVLRGPDSKVVGLRLTNGRVYSLDFRRVEGS